ncbi:MAG: glycosyltransferase [Patescibacteria group bacterium]
MNTEKKILFLVTQSEFGGAQRFIYTLCTNLSGCNITVAAGIEKDKNSDLLDSLEKQKINVKRLNYVKRNINLFFDFLGFFEILKLIGSEKPDILFLCSSKVGFLGSLAGKLLGVKLIIYRIGGWTFNDPWPKWKKNLYIFIEKLSSSWKHYIVNNSSLDKKQAIDLGIKARINNLVIYNGINDLEFLSKEKAREFLNLKNSDYVVGTIANFYPAKGLEYLIESAKELKDYTFLIIGEGEERNMLEKNKPNNVILFGFISHAYKYLKAFDVFVLSSVKEGFPWVILEALKAEIPIVATKVGAVPEIINEYVEICNSDALVKAIKNPKRFEFNKKFDLQTMIKKYEDLIKNG